MIQQIQPLLRGANCGGLLAYVRLIPLASLSVMPLIRAGQVTEEIVLDPGQYCDIWFQSAQLVEEADQTDQGPLYKQKLTLELPRNTAVMTAGVPQLLQLRDFVVLCQDQNGLCYLLGSTDWPLRLSASLGTGRRTSDTNGRTLVLSSDNPVPAALYGWQLFYMPVFTDPGDGSLPGGGGSGGGGTNRLLTFTATTTLGGVSAGEQVTVVDDETGQTTQEMLAPDQPAQASLQASNPVRQFGAPTGVTLSYSVTEGTHPITSVVVNGQAQTYADGSPRLDGTVSAATAPNADATFTLVATDASGATVPASTSVSYRHKRYWGGMVQDPFSLSDVQLSAVLRALSTQEFSTSRSQSFSLTLSDQYAVVARPESQGAGTYTVGGLPNTAIQSRLIQFTNSDGYRESYRIERSAAPDTGTFNFSIS